MATLSEPYRPSHEALLRALRELLPGFVEVDAAALGPEGVCLLVREFSPESGALAVAVEDALAERLGHLVEVTVRAHQGRAFGFVVPGSTVVYER